MSKVFQLIIKASKRQFDQESIDIILSNLSLQDTKAIKKEVFLIEKLHLMFFLSFRCSGGYFSKVEFDI